MSVSRMATDLVTDRPVVVNDRPMLSHSEASYPLAELGNS